MSLKTVANTRLIDGDKLDAIPDSSTWHAGAGKYIKVSVGGTGFEFDTPSTAPIDAYYVTTQAASGLSNEFNLGGLSTGILKQTVSGGISTPSIATDGTDYLSSSTGLKLDQTTPQTIGDTTNRLTKLWATDITVTNAITGSVTGNAGTVTGLSVTSGKKLTVSNSITLTATDGSTLAIGTGGTLGTAAYTASTVYPLLAGRAGGQTLSGSTLTTKNLTLRANAADTTTGSVAIITSTASSSTITGALTVAGGVGVAGALYSGSLTTAGVITCTNATASTTTGTGAVIVTGGMGVGGNIYHGGVIGTAAAIPTWYATQADGASAIGLKIQTSTLWTNADAKLLSVVNNTTEMFSVDKSGNVNIRDGAYYVGNSSCNVKFASSGTLMTITGNTTTAGTIATTNTTASTTTTSGCATFAGGIGVAGSIFAGNLTGGAWTAFTPSWSNLTVGSGGTNTGAYAVVGKTVHFRVHVKLGSSPTVGAVALTLPVSVASYSNISAIGRIVILDAGTAYYTGEIWSNGNLYVNTVSGTLMSIGAFSSTVPMTWVQNDEFMITGTYESA